MFAELPRQGGKLLLPGRAGQLRCPLHRAADQRGRHHGPHRPGPAAISIPGGGLADLLNAALGADRFDAARTTAQLKVGLWRNRPCFPPELLPWAEGSTQVDAVISWENPPTTVFIEMKYLSGLSTNVSNDDGTSGFPSDQLIRNIRVGLHQCGYVRQDGELFAQPPRDFIVLLVAPTKGHPLVSRYRDPDRFRKAIPHSNRLIGLPRMPFIGELAYADLVKLLSRQTRWFNLAERRLAVVMSDYLETKMAQFAHR